jgi:DNA-binding HxlR family transcriptional regulator
LVPGVSERMLSERLTELAAAGLVDREVEEGPPVNVQYRLTDRGEALRPALAELERWGHEQLLSTRTDRGR